MPITETEPMTKLLRFLYLGTCHCRYNFKEKTNVVGIFFQNELDCINSMALAAINLPLTVITRALTNDSLPHHKNAVFALAFCMRFTGENHDKLRSEAYKQFPRCIKTVEDFMMLLKYYQSLGGESTGFGRGIRKCINDWYNSKSADELVKLFTNHRQINGFSHGDIIKLAHVKFTNDNPERKMIFESMLIRPNRFVEKYKDQTGTMTESVKFLYKVFRLRICEDISVAKQIISDDDIKLQHIPAHFYNEATIWEILLPKCNYREILQIFQILHTTQLIKSDNSLAKKIAVALCNQNLISSSNVHPLELLAMKRSYDENNRHKRAVQHDNKRIIKRKLTVNPIFSQKFRLAINRSFQFIPLTGAKFFITLDLRESWTKRHVLGMDASMNCMEAAVLLTLSIVKREKFVRVYSFTGDKNRLKPVSINEKDTFEMAYKSCVENSVKRTFQSLQTPVEYGCREPKKFDVFLTIVDSVARFHRDKPLEMNGFDNYRAAHKQAKYIVLNLAYAKKYLQIDKKGFLEINGLNKNVPKLIHAFVKNQFS